MELLTIANFTDVPTQRGTGILRGLRGGERHGDVASPAPQATNSPDAPSDSRVVYPCTFHHTGRLGGLYTVYAESAQARAEWKEKLEEAIGLRKVVQESNKVFELETLSADAFMVPSIKSNESANPSWNNDNSFTGKVTCSVPFSRRQRCFHFSIWLNNLFPATPDGRALVAVGCAEGVWIGFRHDSRCQCCLFRYRASHTHIAITSDAPRASFEDGPTMCYVRELWYLPRFGRQGK